MPRFFQTFGVVSVLGIIAAALAFCSVALWPTPVAIILAGLSLLATFGALLVLCKATNWAFAEQVRRVIILVSGGYTLGFCALAWKYRATAPALSLASVIDVLVLLLATLAILMLTRSASVRGGGADRN